MPTNPSASPAEPRYRRRWRIPPAYLRGSEPIEGAAILEEFPGPLGLLLWQCVRDVTLWASTPVDQREGLFSADAEPRRLSALLSLGASAREVEEPLRALASLLSHPADSAPEAMMLACERMAQWSEVRGGIATTLAFAQAAAMVAPGSARASLRVGQLARKRGEYARAEGWLQRAIVLARQHREREVHAWSYTALGYLYFLRGNLPAAERSHHRALRIARRHSLISREAAALHDLFVLAIETGNTPEAPRYARMAAAAYGPRHPNLPGLAHDLAVFWIEQGRFSFALPVLETVLPRIDAANQAVALGNLARAAGGAGDRNRFETYWSRALSALGSGRGQLTATTLLNLARGASSIGDTDRAETTALRARDEAEAVGESKTFFEAESLLASLGSRPAAAAMTLEDSPADREIADEFLRSLSLAATG